MSFDITNLAEAVFTVIAIYISSFLIPYLKSKASKEQQDEINKWVKIAVSAAEQIYLGKGRGSEKKLYVIDWLAKHNVKYDSSKIDAMIEAAVYELKQNGLFIPEAILDSAVE